MKWQKKAKFKRIMAGIIAALIVFVMVAGLAAPLILGAEQTGADAAPVITIDGTIGFSDYYKVMSVTPFSISLKNSGGHFKGKLQVKIDTADANSASRYNIYAVPVELPSGGSKVVEMNVPITTLKYAETIALVDEKGREVAVKNLYCAGKSPESVFMGVLTDNRDGMNYLRQLELNDYMGASAANHKLGSNLFFLDETTLPNTKSVLDSFNMIVINDYDTAKLTESQYSALADWVKTGGILIVGAGANAEKVLNGIERDIVSASYEGTVVAERLGNISGGYSLKNDDTPVTLQVIHVDGAMTYTDEQSGIVTTSVFYNESGCVIVHPFDLAVEPFVTLAGRDRFLTDMYKAELGNRLYLKTNYNNFQDFSYLTSNLPPQAENRIGFIFLIVVVYGAVLVPLMYVALKKKDMREKGFAALPALAVLITLVITVISSDTAYKKAIINTVTKIELENGSGFGRAYSAIGVFSPAKGNVKVSFDQNVPITFNPQNYNYYARYLPASRPQNAVELLYSDTPEITFFDMASWAQNNFSTNGEVDMKEGFDCDFHLEGESLIGTITNNTGRDFSEIIVGLKNSLMKVDDVKAGETVEVSHAVKFGDQYYDIYGAISSLYGDVYNPQTQLTAEERRQIYLKQNLISSFVNTDMKTMAAYGGGYGGMTSYASSAPVAVRQTVMTAQEDTMVQKAINVDIFAFNYDKPDDINMKVNGKNANAFHTNLVVMHVPLDFSKMKVFDFPYGLIDVSSIHSESAYDTSDGSAVYLRESRDVTMTFTVMKDAVIDEFQINWETSSGGKEIYNVATEAWEPLKKDAYTANVADYMNESGNIVLRLTKPDAGRVLMPRIRLKGGL